MTKPAASSRCASLAHWRFVAWRRAGLSLVALCSVLLQLSSALHFSLVKHRFNAELGTFAHEHVLLPQRAVAAPPAPSQQPPQLVLGKAACAPEACTLGFAGPVSALFCSAPLQQLIALPLVTASVPKRHAAVDRTRSLLSAPKTSPPVQA